MRPELLDDVLDADIALQDANAIIAQAFRGNVRGVFFTKYFVDAEASTLDQALDVELSQLHVLHRAKTFTICS
jgi:hypothetical protein